MNVRIDDRGIATLEIESHDGEIVSYLLALAPRGLCRWAVELTNLLSGETYHVTLDHAGRFVCTCPAFYYRKSKNHPRSCKHADAVKHLHRLIESLTTETPHERDRAAVV